MKYKSGIDDDENFVNQNILCVCNQYLIGNMLQYQNDKELYNFNKLCMIKVDNAELLLVYLGEKNYIDHLSTTITELQKYIKEQNLYEIFSIYIIDKSTYVIAAKPLINEELFLKIIKKIYNGFQNTKPYQSVAIVARFVVVLNQHNMLEVALEELHNEKNNQKQFIVSDSSNGKLCNLKQELKMINTIVWALQNDDVIPYYQGIYDNKKKCIEKYESLMRIRDSDGNIFTPNSFIDIAKKYHMYTKLSEMMIRRVLAEIEDKDIVVSINLSASDIYCSQIRDTLLEILEKRTSKQLLVLEILEDEIFKDIATLKQFILDVQKLGIKIAIDDFGSGYSNLLELVQISPHYIKICGEIIRALNESPRSRIVLESIVYLSQKLNAPIIAEQVETLEIQKYIESFDIEYSQGYYFSKPLPIEEIQKNQSDHINNS